MRERLSTTSVRGSTYQLDAAMESLPHYQSMHVPNIVIFKQADTMLHGEPMFC